MSFLYQHREYLYAQGSSANTGYRNVHTIPNMNFLFQVSFFAFFIELVSYTQAGNIVMSHFGLK